MRMWLLGSGDPSVDVRRPGRGVGAGMALAARWRSYAESYVLTHGTELVDAGRTRRPFLLRYVL